MGLVIVVTWLRIGLQVVSDSDTFVPVYQLWLSDVDVHKSVDNNHVHRMVSSVLTKYWVDKCHSMVSKKHSEAYLLVQKFISLYRNDRNDNYVNTNWLPLLIRLHQLQQTGTIIPSTHPQKSVKLYCMCHWSTVGTRYSFGSVWNDCM